MKKNINTALQNTWLSTVYLIVLSLVLLVSQLGFAKDRIQYHVQNFDGSTLKVINEQGLVSQSYQYAPFGQQLQLKKPSNLKNPRAFVGGVQDANDLVYLKQRHYNPVLGRFYQPDPITFISGGHGQTNRYQYGWNDTFTFKDTKGTVVESEPNVFMPWVFGTIVHNVFAYQLDNNGQNWNGSVVYSAWGLNFKPDGAQYSTFSTDYNIVELKPISYKYNNSLQNKALDQLSVYKLTAEITLGSNLEAPFSSLKRVNIGGSPSLSSFKMPYLDGYWYTVRYDLSTAQTNGIIYYSKERGNQMTSSEKLKYSSAAAITIGAIGLLNLGSGGKAPMRIPAY